MGSARTALRGDPRSPSARSLRQRCDARRAACRGGRRPLPGLLEEPRHRRDAAPARSARRRVGPPGTHRRDVPRRPNQRHREPLRPPRRATHAARALARRGRHRHRRTGARDARPDGRLRRAHPLRRLERTHGQADPQRRERRDRRLRPRPGDGLRGAAALHAARPDVPLRLERRLHRLRRGDARPRRGRDPLRDLLEDVHDPRDDDERALGAGMDARRAGRRGRGREALRRRVDEFGRGSELRHRSGEHVRLLGLGRRPLLAGLGDRPLDDARDRARCVRRPARRLPRDGRALPRRRHSTATCPRSWACSVSGTRTSSACRRPA